MPILPRKHIIGPIPIADPIIGASLVLCSDFNVHDISSDDVTQPSLSKPLSHRTPDEASVLVNKALLARIEFLESELKECHSKLKKQKPYHFRIADTANNVSLVYLYTGFQS